MTGPSILSRRRSEHALTLAGDPLVWGIAGAAVVLGLLYVALWLVWGAGPVLPEIPWFVPMAHGFIALACLSVAFLALGRYQVLRDPTSYWIGVGCAVGFVGTVFYILAWPGLLPGDRGLIARLPNTSAWLTTIMQCAFGGFLLAAALARQPAGPVSPTEPRRGLGSVALWLVTATLGGAMVVAFEGYLPPLVGPRGIFLSMLFASQFLQLPLFGAGAVLSTRRYRATGDALLGYLAIIQVTMCFAQLAVVIASRRYDIWWFLSRLVATSGLLAAMFGLLSEHVRLYRREHEKARQLELSIAERQQADDALAKSEERLRLAQVSARVGTFDWDIPSNRVQGTPETEALYGLAPGSFGGTYDQWRQLVHPEDLPRVEERLRRTMSGGSLEDEFRVIWPDGSVRWLSSRGHVTTDASGKPLRMIGVNIDITDRKRAEEAAERANRAKDHFLATLSHELRTPLTAVLPALEHLAELVPEEARDVLEMARRNVELEARLIDDLLDVTRIARGKIELRRQAVELGTVLRRAAEVCALDIEARRLRFGIDVEDGPYPLDADPARLQQVFWNLIKNAVKFTPVGGCVSICCQRSDGHVLAQVKDSGMGIEPVALARIFNAFEQVDRSVTQQFGGLGLGLAISRALVELHGGTIHAHSDGKGKGATFTVKLPIQKIAERQRQSPESEHSLPSTQATTLASPLRILLVEDHGDTARIMRRMLQARGHEVETAGDVARALELSHERPFDLLLSDLGLPDGSGLDIIRQLVAQGRRIPAIALSGYGQERDIAQSREAGFAAHLTKPVSMDQLLSTIATVTR